VITVAAVAGLATVQDGGRHGRMHEGVPAGGPLVPELLARANAAVGNADDDPAIELFGAISLEGPRGTLVAGDDGTAHELGERGGSAPWRVACGGARVRYVAVRGGIDVPWVLGGRGTLLLAGLGGHEGRALRRGDVLRAGAAPRGPRRPVSPPALDLDGDIFVVLGPDLDRFEADAVDTLLASTFQVTPQSDRVGIRLSGPTLPGRGEAVGPSCPMTRGAIQIPPSGLPVVLGPDHPTTGGYPVLGTVVSASLGAIGARRVGAHVRFAVARMPEERATGEPSAAS
jgi:5-oxoprolinase (ATP-hydrolysing) subunit C